MKLVLTMTFEGTKEQCEKVGTDFMNEYQGEIGHTSPKVHLKFVDISVKTEEIE